MTIQEVLKSGKPFKRKSWGAWYKCIKSHSPWLTNIDDKNRSLLIGYKDILATDWEIKQ